MERFYDTLFEVSNDYRYNILLLLKNEPMRTTTLSKKLKVTTQEISRHTSRLSESDLIYKDVEGLYHLSNYGNLIHILLEEFLFVTKHRKYFVTHTINQINPEFIKKISSLSKSTLVDDTLQFLHYIDKLIRESKNEVWLLVDHYPLTFLGSILEGINKGVKFRIAELDEISSGPHMNLESLDEAKTIERARKTSLSESKTLSDVGVFMFISEDKCAIAFPTTTGEFDYKGFISSDKQSLEWCTELFLDHWNQTKSNIRFPKLINEQETTLAEHDGTIVITGRDSISDAQKIQDAVNKYQEILLKGSFNFGTSTITIEKSVRIRGEISKGQYLTKIYKKGWAFPFNKIESVFKINNSNAEVSIENIHFTDFNGVCIDAPRSKALKILNNKMTLETGFGRGWTNLQHGDIISGVWIENPTITQNNSENFNKGIVIEGNYLDFSSNQLSSETNTRLTESIKSQNSSLNLSSHEYYVSIGFNLIGLSSKIEIKNNTILNMNARGISLSDISDETYVKIEDNHITANIPGSYPFRRPEAGVGVFTQNSNKNAPQGSVTITRNDIKLECPDYCGIIALDSTSSKEKSVIPLKIEITDNKIHLKDGQACIKTDSDEIVVTNNIFSGNAFFGVMNTTTNTTEKTSINKNTDLNDVTNLKLIDPWFWVSRNKPV